MMPPNRVIRYAIPRLRPLQSYDWFAEQNAAQACVPTMNGVYLVEIPPNDDTYHSPTLWARKLCPKADS